MVAKRINQHLSLLEAMQIALTETEVLVKIVDTKIDKTMAIANNTLYQSSNRFMNWTNKEEALLIKESQ